MKSKQWDGAVAIFERDFDKFLNEYHALELHEEHRVEPTGAPKSCNRHVDCVAANLKWLHDHPAKQFVPMNFHCYDDECEDCFGC